MALSGEQLLEKTRKLINYMAEKHGLEIGKSSGELMPVSQNVVQFLKTFIF